MSVESIEGQASQLLPSVIPPPGTATVETPIEGLLDKHIYGFNSRDQRSRPFNLLRSQVLKLARSRNWRVIGITSATPRVGKSFIACNLAAAMARTPEMHTYLFDFDLRRSSLAEYFGLEGEIGVTDYLDGRIPDLTSVARDVAGERLSLFPSFENQHHSAELLAGAPMDRLIEDMRRLPDNSMCLCDLPPVFANDDAVIIAQKIDAYILVVEEGVTTRKQVRDTFALLSPAPCLGTVLNRYQGGLMGDDYGYGYGQSQKYAEYYS
ncbi:MAG: CpsD/CapB family tyrosine-protein kinase [Sphingomonas sp.]|nr:CpsD/CapB family tyrosine-protein kinase [Sphingomonas sp.]MDX3883422.1 CpsD/CapB family tyrosine-protein kinase [Sphingomonas sp.]